jgi:hypothetical protein
MKDKINRMMIRSVSQANCAPGGILLAMLIILGVCCYMYRHVIEQTLLLCAAIVLCVGVLGAAVVVVLSLRRWRRRTGLLALREREAAAAVAADQIVPANPPSLEAAADQLADPDVGIRFSPDGETLEVMRTGAEQ